MKFIRLAEVLISEASTGVLGYITNHSYIDNPTFRGLRRSLQTTFDGAISILDLHGNTKKGDRDQHGQPDKNVFDIQQGVAVAFMVKAPTPASQRSRHADLLGTRGQKYRYLETESEVTTRWADIAVAPSFYLFTPQDRRYVEEYESWIALTDAMPLHSNGIVTARDHLCVRWTQDEAWSVVQEFASLEAEAARQVYELGPDSRDWQVALAQADLNRDGPTRSKVVPILNRPFDVRWTYFTGRSRGFLCMPRPNTMKRMIDGNNLALVASRMTKGERFQHIQVSRNITEAIVMSPRTSNNGFIFPLFIDDVADSGMATLELAENHGDANLSREFLDSLSPWLGRPALSADPEHVLAYIYAVLHSPGYRERYADLLKIDFPRIPIAASGQLFRELVRLGGELVALHLTEAPIQQATRARYVAATKMWHVEEANGASALASLAFTGPERPRVSKVGWSDETVWIDAVKVGGGYNQ